MWTQGQISLLPMCESKNNAKSYTNVIAKVFRRTSDGADYMYVANGNVLEYSSNFSAADGSVTWTTVTALASPQTIPDIASDLNMSGEDAVMTESISESFDELEHPTITRDINIIMK